jgi:hypothetical protein
VSRAANRLVTGAAGLVGVVCTTVLTAAPARADDVVGPSEGHDPGDSLGVAGALLLYVVIPLAVLGVVAALVMLPGVMRGGRYRPARGWGARPVWFAGPVQPEAAIAGAETGDVVRGGASGSW